MGVYDWVTCKYPVPGIDGIEKLEFQSYDTPSQFCDRYEIREDGTLWHWTGDQRLEVDKKHPLGFALLYDNQRWEKVDHSGQIAIHGETTIVFWFRDGVIADHYIDESDYVDDDE